jgi:hypothetical protein
MITSMDLPIFSLRQKRSDIAIWCIAPDRAKFLTAEFPQYE